MNAAAITPALVAENVCRIRQRIAAAAARAGRRPEDVVLVAAAKTKGADLVRAVIAAGVEDIGENYVQEAEEKRAVVECAVRWHLIGHLQRNKVRRAVGFDVVQSVDSYGIAAGLARQCAAAGKRLTVMIEVNLGREATKNGVGVDRLADLVARVRELRELSLQGLMAIPPPGGESATRFHFRRLRKLAEGVDLPQLSMGMSDDFEVAIEEGATIVRVGRGIFGERS